VLPTLTVPVPVLLAARVRTLPEIVPVKVAAAAVVFE
jgi:hypothetical protein